MVPKKFLPKKIIFLLLFAAAFITFAAITKQPKAQNKVNTSSAGNKEEIRKIAKELYDACRYKQQDCYETKITNELLAKYPLPGILDAIYDYDTYFSCHAFMHFVGRSLYKKTQSIPDSYAQINYTCHGGAYHGVIEAYLDQRKITVNDLGGNEIEAICKDSKSKIEKQPDQIFFECFHGFGHAFMFITNSNLPASLAYCDKLTDISYREACYGGDFMENSTSSTNRDHKSAWTKADDKFYPCTILEEKYLNQCYFYQSNYWIMQSNRNYPETFQMCKKITGHPYDYCILGLGASLASVSNEQGMEKAALVCYLAPDYYSKQICIEGAVPSIADRYGGDLTKDIEYCGLINASLKEFCFGKINQIAPKWGKTAKDIDILCQKVENWKDACLGKKPLQFKY